MKKIQIESIWGKVIGLLLLVITLPILLILLNYMFKDLSIWLLGHRINAEVTEVGLHRTSDAEESELEFNYYVNYQFALKNGTIVTGTSKVGVMEWSAMEIGDQVPVKYFPLIPSNNRLDDARFVGFSLCTYVPITMFALAGFAGAIHLLKPFRKSSHQN